MRNSGISHRQTLHEHTQERIAELQPASDRGMYQHIGVDLDQHHVILGNHVRTAFEIALYKMRHFPKTIAAMQQGSLRLVDVRTDAEVARGKIPLGESLPLHLLPLRLNEMNKDAATVFYCQIGGRSAQAAAFAVAHGFSEVYNLQGGITAWSKAGLPIES
jgi:rhodanese-related sulfurtransferase